MLSNATVILRGYNYEQVRTVAEVLVGSKVRNMEITLNTEGAIDIIKKISDEFQDHLLIGAGTVLSLEALKKAHHAGAKFALAPNMMSKEMLTYCNKNNIIAIPGSFSPSEISESFRNGADIVKVFPANELSYSYAKKVCEPLGSLPLMAVGGVNEKNVREVLNSGYQYVGSAGGIFKKEDILNQNKEGLNASLRLFESGLE
ncbi:bifunctional 4-hydroxy-2-oxoglutarate aldolase/2-dehydro-3-deoxy-phosphogluconate aldolase [Erysipelothrix tonsillarum]|uniref:bifunctional 4-hydroxy-2-oxoglutarate aldolase/2-dehydro-3-deoxy-phosphogluconate aldolase n=1 Tax=Erysipelothrix tonsillarum TaxID=38402 RepID=UPI0003660E92|nr:bifunctional 4-hydroxy-2-oxoglutarate aldolase/2-dehydro-3-deoxy-phosphogluconate aldolase [Erysipelothrix tonsillarum]